MGIQMSKATQPILVEKPASSARTRTLNRKGKHHEDFHSRATASTTEVSSSLSSSLDDNVPMADDYGASSPKGIPGGPPTPSDFAMVSQRWRGPHWNNATAASRPTDRGYHDTRKLSSTPGPGRSTSVPMKCPPRRSTVNILSDTSDDDPYCSDYEDVTNEDTQYLARMYDSRTWEMYRRITESRKQQQMSQGRLSRRRTDHSDYNTQEQRGASSCGADDDATCELPSPRNEQEMIFVFDLEE